MLFTQLRAFHAIVTEGSFTRAAEYLNLTQPTVSAHINTLESHYGVLLFDRRGREMKLTQTGEQLYGLVHRMVTLAKEIDEYLLAVEAESNTALKIGTDSPYSISDLVTKSCQADEKLTITLSTGIAEEIEQDILNGHLDVALLVRVSDDSRLLVSPFRRHSIRVGVGAKHPWAKRRRIVMQDLQGQALILRQPDVSQTSRVFEAAMRHFQIRARRVLTVDSREAMREAIAADAGIGVVVQQEAQMDKRIRALSISDATLEVSEHLVCERERAKSQKIQKFLALLELGPSW